MKRFTLILLFALTFYYSYTQQISVSHVTISGKISNAKDIIYIKELDEISVLQSNLTRHELTIDNNGRFQSLILLEKPKYFMIGFNELYLEPGDSLSMEVDMSFQQRSSFKGIGAEKQEYLKHVPWQKSGSYLNAGVNIKSTYEETVASIQLLAKDQEKDCLT